MSFQDDLIKTITRQSYNSTYLTIHNYHNVKNGKIADWNIVFNVSYKNALKKSIDIIKSLPLKQFAKHNEYPIYVAARDELLNSFDLSINDMNYSPAALSYTELYDCNNKLIPGLKLHIIQDIVHLTGFVANCRIIVLGKNKNPSINPIIQAKKNLRSLTPLGNWVQFKLEDGRFEKIVVSKKTICFMKEVEKNINTLYKKVA